ncbi:peptidoglycan DD-metalloendopeptidase family protein [Wenzhouxiangella sp. XN79A]|uniref:murein hydrolase activator EnvC family protein n=1 Tax=Wenzhouxiangella sp. XN79A TaxID=2724193 RepID=UPI00144A5096|nr:peptidoglycan DD-metalloendopeptidase family protein [Wenzhouxiangella sp. XN79A]NKI35539.1 peptidoglycan DD-metalloendopeptidase family protein [Wenzhouxiangella sp. XN79A]
MKRCAAWALVAALALPGLALAQPRDPAEVEAELAELRSQIESIAAQLAEQRETEQAEQAALAGIERELAGLARTLRETETALTRVRGEIQDLQDEAGSLQSAIETQRERLADQLQAAYRLGSQSRLRTLLNAEDPNRISRQLAMHGYLGRARAELVDALVDNERELARVLTTTRERELELEQLGERQRAALAAQQDAREARERALADLARRIRSDEAQLAERRAAAAELQDLLERLSSVLADIPPELAARPFGDLRGALPMPLDGPVRAAYADRRNADSAWLGWLIEAETGDEVRAVAYGRVAYADWLRGYGMMLILDHGDGWMTLYGHNQALLADVGDWVEPGQAVALAGASGGEGATGLYFQLRHQGEPVDPAGWLDR